MKLVILSIFSLFFTVAAFANEYPTPEHLEQIAKELAPYKKEVKNFEKALKIMVGDLSKSTELKWVIVIEQEGICASGNEDGYALIGELYLAHSKRVDNGEGLPKFETVYEHIKSYAVTTNEAASLSSRELSKAVMTNETCAE